MPAQDKLDLFKANKIEYATPKKPTLIKMAPAQYLSIEGGGEPGGEEFQACIEAMYGTAYTLKFAGKDQGNDYTVCKLEGQWWNDGGKPFKDAAPHEIHYKLLIRTPEFVKKTNLKNAQKTLEQRGKAPRAKDVILETLKEGMCVQMLYIGPYDHEYDTIQTMLEFARGEGYSKFGLHHEIYLSDPRRVPPERLKTILRYPVMK